MHLELVVLSEDNDIVGINLGWSSEFMPDAEAIVEFSSSNKIFKTISDLPTIPSNVTSSSSPFTTTTSESTLSQSSLPTFYCHENKTTSFSLSVVLNSEPFDEVHMTVIAQSTTGACVLLCLSLMILFIDSAV